jgi:hypothetical protein
LTLDQTLRIARIRHAKYLKLDARRTRVNDEDRIHGGQACGNGALLRRVAA